jgi:eukaryotic-like serine/threonine-protein kinase
MAITRGVRFGPYEVTALIGVGGMGEVYRATDLSLKRDVALKVLPENLLTDASLLARLQREAEVLASLNHANVAQIHGLERGEGRTALVMELVDGPTLAERVAEGALQQREAVDLALQLAAALEAAHERGIVHRDLKPANIKLTNDGTLKVLDFGIAKALDVPGASGAAARALTGPAMTEGGVVLGTAAYMSPEQARGKPVDKRTDVWAFGCVLYEMLTGRAAFLGDDATSTLAHVLERDPDMRLLPADLSWTTRRTIELCLRKDLKERARDIGDVRLALEGEFAAPVPQNQPTSRRAWPVAAALAIAVLGAGAYWALRTPGPAVATSPLPVTRFVITPPATAPLSNLTGYDFALSPDGRRLAYLGQNAATGGVALYVRELAALEPKRLPGTDVLNPWSNTNPFFSPDGKSIAYTAPDGRMIRARLDGAPPQTAFQPGLIFGATWIADDTLIVSTGTRLERIRTDGGAPEPLTPAVADQFVAAPSVLPGGNAVLFMSSKGDARRVAVLDLETGEQKILIEGAQKPFYASTGHIVFARGATLMAAPFDARERVLTGEPVALLDGLRTNNTPDFTLSANGTLAYVPANDGDRRHGALVWVDRTGAVVGRAVAESLDTPSDPRLSPDGTRVVLTLGAYVRGRLWIYDLRGRPPVPLAADEGGDAIWSADGRDLAFMQYNTGLNLSIFALPSSGNGVAQRKSMYGIPQDWSAAGDLLFSSLTRDIRAAPIAGGEARDVVATGDDEFDAALSPNGRWIAYVSDRTGQPEVWVQSYADLGAAPVRVSGSGGYEPRWSADGKELFYRQGGSVYAAAVDSGAELSFETPVMLFSGAYFGAPVPETRSYDVARDGRFLMIQLEDSPTSNETPASVVIVENWFEELKQRVPTR